MSRGIDSGLGYDAFISYSHAQGRYVAEALQSGLENFARPWYRPRQLRVFRDKTNLAATPALWPSIESALAASRWFILIASPEASASRWVRKEIAWWLANRQPTNILVAQTAGEIVWAGRDFDWNLTTALPHELADSFINEPLWIDLRRMVPRSSAADADSPSGHRVHLGDLVAEFAAPIRGIDKDSLVGDHVRTQRRTRRTVRAVVATLLTLLIAVSSASVVAARQRDEAVRQRDNAVALRLATLADSLRDTRPDVALLLGVEATKIAPVQEAFDSLVATLAQSHFGGALAGHTDQIDAIAVNPAGTLAATASADSTIGLWDVSDPSRRVMAGRLHDLGGYVTSVDFDSTGRLLAVSGMQTPTQIWDVSEPLRPRRLATLERGSTAVEFSPRQPILAVSGGLWNISDPAHPSRVGSLAFADAWDIDISEDGRIMVVAAGPASTTVWDISDPHLPVRLAVLADHAGTAALNSRGDLLVTGPKDGPAQLWELSNRSRPKLLAQLSAGTGTTVFDASFAPDDMSVATGEDDGAVVWDIEDPSRPVERFRARGHPSYVDSLAYVGAGDRLITGGADGVARMWSVGDAVHPSPVTVLGPFSQPQEIVRFSPDGGRLFTSEDGSSIAIWDVNEPLHPMRIGRVVSDDFASWNVSVSPNGRILARETQFQPPQLWDVENAAAPVDIGPLGDVPAKATFAPDGATLVRVADGNADLWDVADPRKPIRLSRITDGVLSGTFSPDGRILALSQADAMALWDVSDRGRPMQLSRMGDSSGAVAFRPDGRVLAIDDGHAQVAVWDISKPEQPNRVAVLSSKHGRDLAFTPNGLALVMGDSGPTATFWSMANPAAPRLVAELKGHEGSIYNLAISARGLIATGSFDRTVRLWHLPHVTAFLNDPVAAACALAGPTLTPEDWQRYLPTMSREPIC